MLAPDQLKLESSFHGPLRIWTQPDPARPVCIGVDTAGGKSENDWSVIVGVDAASGSTVFTWRGHCEPDELAEYCVLLGHCYGAASNGQAYICPEINNHGIALLQKLRELGYYQLYTVQTWDSIEKAFVPRIGFNTNVKSKPVLIRRGREALANGYIKVRDLTILKELSTFVRTDSGRDEAMEGCHDDAAMAWMLALEARHVFYVEAGKPVETSERVQEEPSQPKRQDETARWVWGQLKKAKAKNKRTAPRRSSVRFLGR